MRLFEMSSLMYIRASVSGPLQLLAYTSFAGTRNLCQSPLMVCMEGTSRDTGFGSLSDAASADFKARCGVVQAVR